jgi:hypothetical protein
MLLQALFPSRRREMDPALRLQPDQQTLTPEQEAEARHMAEAFIQARLSTEPVDEPEAEALVRQAYAAAGLAPPQPIHWVDGPLQLVAVLAPSSLGASVLDRLWGSVRDRVGDRVRASVEASVVDSVGDRVLARVGEDSMEGYVWDIAWGSLRRASV